MRGWLSRSQSHPQVGTYGYHPADVRHSRDVVPGVDYTHEYHVTTTDDRYAHPHAYDASHATISHKSDVLDCKQETLATGRTQAAMRSTAMRSTAMRSTAMRRENCYEKHCYEEHCYEEGALLREALGGSSTTDFEEWMNNVRMWQQ